VDGAFRVLYNELVEEREESATIVVSEDGKGVNNEFVFAFGKM
jgi:hypothetical protein